MIITNRFSLVFSSVCHYCLLLCSSIGRLSLVNVLGMCVFLFCILLCPLANLRVGKIEIRQVSDQIIHFFQSINLHSFRMDCTEAQFSFIAVHMVSTLSPTFWSKSVSFNVENIRSNFCRRQVPYLQIELRILVALLMIGSTIWSSFNNIRLVSQGGCGRNFSSVAVSEKIAVRQMEKELSFFRARVLFFPVGQLDF